MFPASSLALSMASPICWTASVHSSLWSPQSSTACAMSSVAEPIASTIDCAPSTQASLSVQHIVLILTRFVTASPTSYPAALTSSSQYAEALHAERASMAVPNLSAPESAMCDVAWSEDLEGGV